jgi:hypothetical protein
MLFLFSYVSTRRTAIPFVQVLQPDGIYLVIPNPWPLPLFLQNWPHSGILLHLFLRVYEMEAKMCFG